MIRTSMLAVGLAAAMACGGAVAQAQTKMTDAGSQTFITKAIQGDLAEIEVGKLAQQKGATGAVRDFGQKLVADHTDNKTKAEQVAKQMGMTPPSEPSAADKAEYKKLQGLSGKQFDETLAKDMVKDHKTTIAGFEREAKKSGPAADFAKDSLPTLQEHLRTAENLNGSQTTGSK